uniref:Round spermatid basic protein 1-like protein n=1 Tax=Lygus hesperus TaxID=30085 RepID=A0A0A9X9C8_LYGHE
MSASILTNVRATENIHALSENMGELKVENNIKLEIKDEQDTAVDSTLPDLPFVVGPEDSVTPVADSSTHSHSTVSHIAKTEKVGTTTCDNAAESIVGSTVDCSSDNNFQTDKTDSPSKKKPKSYSSSQKDSKHYSSRNHHDNLSNKNRDYSRHSTHSSSKHHSSSHGKHSSSHGSDKKRDVDRKHEHSSSRRHESSSNRKHEHSSDRKHERSSDRKHEHSSDRKHEHPSDRRHGCSKCHARQRIKKAHIGVQCRRDRTIPKLTLTNEKFVTTVNRCVPVSTPLDDLKYGKYMRIDTYPNGGASVVHMHQEELNHLSPSELDELSKEFFEVVFGEDEHGSAHHVMGIVHNSANYLPDLLDHMAESYPNLTVKNGVLCRGSDIETTTMASYKDQVYKNYCNGTVRYGPLHQISLVGTVTEEVGGFFPDLLNKLEETFS